MNKLAIEQKVLAGFVLALAIISLVGGLAYRVVRDYIEISGIEKQNSGEILLLEKIFSNLNEAESAQRAYLISNHDFYLQRRRDTLAGTSSSLLDLKQIAIKNPQELLLLPALEQKINQRVTLLEEVLSRGMEGGLDAARRMFPGNDGTKEMEEIHGIINAMIKAEEKQGEQLSKDADADTNRIQAIAVLMVILVAFFFSLLYWQVRREMAERRKIQTELEEVARLDSIHSLLLALFNSSFDRNHIFQGMLSMVAEKLPFPVSAVYGYDELGGILRCELSWGTPEGMKREFRLGEGLVGQVAQAGKPAALEKIGGNDITIEAGLASFTPAAVLAYPINYQDHLMGVLVLAAGQSIDERHRSFLAVLCSELGVALYNIKQHTDLKLMAEQLRLKSEEIAAKNDRLEESSRMKSEFMANMSHELRTPLNSIIGFSEAIQAGLAGEVNPKQQEYAGDILNSGQHLLELINDILDISKIEAGMMTLELDAVEISSLLHNSLSVVREKAAANSIVLQSNIPEDLGIVYMDGRKCKQIVYNLLANAEKFTPSGGTIFLRAKKVGRDAIRAFFGGSPVKAAWTPKFNQYIEISVTDTGIGISKDDLSKLFQPFIQLDASLARKYEGTGLGLAIIKKLAELHGGTVGVESEPGKGSCFTVWLPCRTEGGQTTQNMSPISEYGPLDSVEAPLALMVEDNEKAAGLIKLQLEAEGIRVIHALTAEDGLRMIKEYHPDFVTLDILLPGMDGWKFLELVKADQETAHIPVVIISIVSDASKGTSLGAARILQKPVSSDALIGALAELNFIPNGSQYKVLVVDDDPNAIELITLHLENAKYTTLRAYGGREGIEIAQRERPDFIVLDLMMPEVSGFDVVEALKGNPETAQIPIMIMTAKVVTAEDRKILNGNVQKIMIKTEFKEHFINEVHRALKRGGKR